MAGSRAPRKLDSWIERFVEHHSSLEVPPIFLKWAAITAVGSVLEQKVWMNTGTELYPNIYTFLIAEPGIGKTRSVRSVRSYLSPLQDFKLAPISLTRASLVDFMIDAKHTAYLNGPGKPVEYHSMFITADEISAFMSKYERDTVGLLSSFYDVDSYSEWRRAAELKVKIDRPQISMLCGSTPSNLMNLIPSDAWDQGFMSRIILVFSDKQLITDMFETESILTDKDLAADIFSISRLTGQFDITTEFKKAAHQWRTEGSKPLPTHPKLHHYNSRRLVHLFKLSMISAIDKGDALILSEHDFKRAFAWLTEAEAVMPEIFKVAVSSPEAGAIDEIYHYVQSNDKGYGVPERKVVQFACTRVETYKVTKLLEMMITAGRLEKFGINETTKTGIFRAIDD